MVMCSLYISIVIGCCLPSGDFFVTLHLAFSGGLALVSGLMLLNLEKLRNAIYRWRKCPICVAFTY